MPFSVVHDPEQDIVELHFTGVITPDDLTPSSEACFALQRQTGSLRYLIDSDTWSLEVSSFDIHALPAKEYPKAEIDRRTRIAVVAPSNDQALANARFYEDACRNRGWNARLLPDREAALAWLQGA